MIPARMAVTLLLAATLSFAQQPGSSQASAPKRTKTVGTVKSIGGNIMTIATDAGAEVTVTVQSTTRLVRMVPGQADLKSAPAIQLSDIQPGDRVAVAGVASDDGKSLTATTAALMKQSDVAEKQQRDLKEWQKNGVGGKVKAVDAAAGSIVVATGAMGGGTATVHVSANTVYRRYAADSWNYDDAKPGTLAEIKEGDQLNARGAKSDDGKELTAVEVVSGTFRSIAATMLSADTANNTLTVTDLATRRPVTLKIAANSQLHQLPAMFAQRLAMRLKGVTPAAGNAGAGGSAPTHAGGGEGRPGGGSGARPDFQQMLNRMPAVTPSQLQKGDALMIVATEGAPDSPSKIIVLLSGVEAILAAVSPSEATTVLSPWNLSAAANAGTGDTP